MTTLEDAAREFEAGSPHMENVGLGRRAIRAEEPLDHRGQNHVPIRGKISAEDGDLPAKDIVCRKVTEDGDLPIGTLMTFSLGCPPGWETMPDLSELNAIEAQRGDAPRATIPDPKKSWGDEKLPAASLNPLVLLEEAHMFRIGAHKYGAFNYVGEGNEKSAMTYVHAIKRHITLWEGGEDNDPDSGVSHLVAIRAGCGILRTQQINCTLIDDRPDWGPVRMMMDKLDALWLKIRPKLDEQIEEMKK